MTRGAKLDTKWKARFIRAMRETGHAPSAAKASNRDPSVCYKQKKKDAEFSAAWDSARDEWLDRKMRDELQNSVTERAINGWLEPVYHKGAVVGAKRKYSDVLAIFLLKSWLPDRYGPNVNEMTNEELGAFLRGALSQMREQLAPPGEGAEGASDDAEGSDESGGTA